MKHLIIPTLILALTTFARAEATVTLEGVHNCCKSCATGITKAATSVKGVTAEIDGTKVTLTAKNESSAKKAVEAIMDAGYYGTTGAEASTTAAAPASKKLKGATVTNVHLCCGKCVKAVDAAVKTVAGVTGATIESKATSFTVEGEFDEAELVAALNKAGFQGKVGK
ncbi:MAG: cation transporter [Verrucomicrobiales bacterium]|nr:cation transporter [Verrucomicrobiales bacterium]MCP5560664.1 cation transporter [Verrucomicrobiaceae bacterium]